MPNSDTLEDRLDALASNAAHLRDLLTLIIQTFGGDASPVLSALLIARDMSTRLMEGIDEAAGDIS